jgi:hypothetical protein
VLKRKIHQLARHFNIRSTTIGRPCAICEEFGLEAGLRFVDANPEPRPKAPNDSRPRLLDPAYKNVFSSKT